MNFLLEITKEDYGSSIIATKGFAETLGFGAQILLIGMLTVFTVLCILWIALMIFKFFFHDLAKQEHKEVAAPAPTPTPDHVAAPVSSDDEIVAVIAAAIAMAESETSNGIKFRVVSFKRR